MRCPNCQREIPVGEDVRFCPHCGRALQAAAARTGLTAPGQGAAGTGPSAQGTTGLTTPTPGAPRPEPPKPPRPPSWKLQKERAEEWVRGRIDVDEVLGVQGNEPWDEIQSRWQNLQESAGRWERHPTDADLQRLGQQILKRIQEVRDYFKEETAFRRFVEDQRRKRLEKKYSDRLDELTRQDQALQVDEWRSLIRQATEDGLQESRLRDLVEAFAKQHAGFLIGIEIGDRRCMTPDEVRDLWDREGPARIARVDREQMARWIEICVGDKEKAEQWRQGQIAHVFWGWGSRVCWLGDRPLRTPGDWVEGVYRGDLEKESLERMDLIADWLEVVYRRGEWADRLRQAGNLVDEKERRRVLWQVLWATGERPDPAVAYEGTARLLRADPEFLEGQCHHVIHCARAKRYDEGRRALQTLLESAERSGTTYEYLPRLERELREFPAFWPQARELLDPYKARSMGQPFMFRQGQAKNLLELAQLCDRFPEEARGYLMDQRFERWLDAQGNAPLADETKHIVNDYRARPDRALEMFVRALYRSSNQEQAGTPRLRVEPPKIEWKNVPVGAVVQGRVQLNREGRGHVWGTVRVEGSNRDLKWTQGFDRVPATIDLELDTARYEPGTYTATLVIQPDGLPPIRIPLTWQVISLTVALAPASIDFGQVPGGSRTAEVRIECRTPNGRILVDEVTPQPPMPGLQIETHVRDGTPVVAVRWDTNALETGRTYRTNLRISTNVGTWSVPVAILRGIPWAAILPRAVGLGILIGVILLVVRSLWFVDTWTSNFPLDLPPNKWEGSLVARLAVGGALVLVSIYGYGRYIVGKKKREKTAS